MTLTAEETVVAAGDVYLGDVGETEPADPTDDLAALELLGWRHLGYIQASDGVTFGLERNVIDIEAVQSADPIRKIVESVIKTLRFNLQQWNVQTFPFAFGGGEVVEISPGIFEYEPPDIDVIDEKALLWAFADGTKSYMLTFRRGNVVGSAETQGVRNNVALLPIEFGVLTPSGGLKPFNLLTDDPAFTPVAS